MMLLLMGLIDRDTIKCHTYVTFVIERREHKTVGVMLFIVAAGTAAPKVSRIRESCGILVVRQSSFTSDCDKDDASQPLIR